MRREFRSRWFVFVLTLVCFGMLPAEAGSVRLTWQPSSGATGYKLHYGSSAGSLSTVLDVGNVTQFILQNLPDCALSHFAVSAYNSAGESGVSASVSSWPRPVPTAATPQSADQGTSTNVNLDGVNFQSGLVVDFANPGITVNSTSVTSCNRVVVGITVTSNAATGPTDVSIALPNGVTGIGSSLFAVLGEPLGTVTDVHRTDVQQ